MYAKNNEKGVTHIRSVTEAWKNDPYVENDPYENFPPGVRVN